jgi:hypothetical protein
VGIGLEQFPLLLAWTTTAEPWVPICGVNWFEGLFRCWGDFRVAVEAAGLFNLTGILFEARCARVWHVVWVDPVPFRLGEHEQNHNDG